MTQPRTVVNTLLHEKKRKISGGFYHRLQVDFAYNSNHIEGSRLTHEQTRYIFETHTVDGTAHVNDILEAANHFKCIDYVLDTVNVPITEAYIKHLHRLLKNGLIEDDYDDVVIGDYKKYPNEVGQISTVHPKEVASHMEKLIDEFSAKKQIDLYDVVEFHAEFERIHLFYINDESKLFYYTGLKEWQMEQKRERLLDVFLSMQDDMKCILDYFEIEYDRTELRARDFIEKHVISSETM